MNKDNEDFESLFSKIIINSSSKTASEITEEILDELKKFTGRDEHFDDDIALIVFDVK